MFIVSSSNIVNALKEELFYLFLYLHQHNKMCINKQQYLPTNNFTKLLKHVNICGIVKVIFNHSELKNQFVGYQQILTPIKQVVNVSGGSVHIKQAMF